MSTVIANQKECLNEEGPQLTNFELFETFSVTVSVNSLQRKQRAEDYIWHSGSTCYKEFVIVLDNTAEIVISLSEIKTFKEGQIVNMNMGSLKSNLTSKKIFIII